MPCFWSMMSDTQSRIDASGRSVIRIVYVLVDHAAFFLVNTIAIGGRKVFEDLFNGDLDRGAGLLPLAPVQHKLLSLQGIQQILHDFLHHILLTAR